MGAGAKEAGNVAGSDPSDGDERHPQPCRRDERLDAEGRTIGALRGRLPDGTEEGEGEPISAAARAAAMSAGPWVETAIARWGAIRATSAAGSDIVPRWTPSAPTASATSTRSLT